MLGVTLYGLRPGWHHLTNVFLHALNSILLFVVLRRMTGALWRSAFVALLFAIHPLHVEAGRLDLGTERGSERPVLVSLDLGLRRLRQAAARGSIPAAAAGVCLRPDVEADDRHAAHSCCCCWITGRWGVGRLRRPGRLILEKAPLVALAAAAR